MYKKILVPLDGSKRAEAVLCHIEEMALNYDAEIALVRVADPAYLTGPEHNEFDADEYHRDVSREVDEAKSYLLNVQRRLKEKGIKSHIHVVLGPPVEAITTTAQTEDADLIAIASHGHGGLSRVFYGSVAAGVLHRADRPVFVVRAGAGECE